MSDINSNETHDEIMERMAQENNPAAVRIKELEAELEREKGCHVYYQNLCRELRDRLDDLEMEDE